MLLERSRHLELLSASLAAAREGSRGRLVLVGGEAGVGKTTLLRRFCAAESPSARTLWGGCDALFTPRPLGPLLDIAESLGGELESLAAGGARPSDLTVALGRELRASVPTVLVLEDLHWADEATLDVLRLLARRLESVPALVVATFRDNELDRRHPLTLVLGELSSRPAVDRLQMQPLSAEAVAELAQPHGVDPEELYRKTGGNPFFVTEVLAADEEEIPLTVRDAVRARAARLSASAQALLEAVAVVPPRIELWLLEQLAPGDVDSLEECLGSGMLADESDAVAFRHELARLAVEELVAPDRRRDLHLRALAALAAPPTASPDLARLAHHAEAAGDAEAVLRYAPAAGDRAASLGAHREAAAQFARALGFADGLSAVERAALLERRSYECYLTDQTDEAVAAREAALACWRETADRLREGDSLRWLSRLYWFQGRNPDAERVGREAVALLEGLPPGPELAMAYSNLSQLHMLAEEMEAAIAWGSRAIELADRLGELETLVHALNNVGMAEATTGRGTEKIERSLALAEEAGLEEHVARAYTNLSSRYCERGPDELADEYLTRGIDYSLEHDLESWRLYMLASRANHKLQQGRWEEAADDAAEVLRNARTAPISRVSALEALGLIRARRGDPEAWPLLDEALTLAEPTGELQRVGPVATSRAEARLLEGRSEAAAAETEAAFRLARERRNEWVLGQLAWLRRQAGVEEAVPEGVAEPYRLQLTGEWRRAAEVWTAMSRPYQAALALAESDDEDDLHASLAALQELGAGPAAAIVARGLRERGARGVRRGPRASTRSNPAGLTSRELEVAGLVSEGLTNGEIAARLFLAEKTVDHHVSAVLRKLGVRTRAQASAEAVRLGIAAQDR